MRCQSSAETRTTGRWPGRTTATGPRPASTSSAIATRSSDSPIGFSSTPPSMYDIPQELPQPEAELDRLAEYYDTHDTSAEMETGDWVEPQPMATTSLRLPVEVIDQLKRQAQARQIRYASYARSILEQWCLPGPGPAAGTTDRSAKRISIVPDGHWNLPAGSCSDPSLVGSGSVSLRLARRTAGRRSGRRRPGPSTWTGPRERRRASRAAIGGSRPGR